MEEDKDKKMNMSNTQLKKIKNQKLKMSNKTVEEDNNGQWILLPSCTQALRPPCVSTWQNPLALVCLL